MANLCAEHVDINFRGVVAANKVSFISDMLLTENNCLYTAWHGLIDGIVLLQAKNRACLPALVNVSLSSDKMLNFSSPYFFTR